MKYYDKINNLIQNISVDLKERDEQIKMSILAMLGGESIFFLGPPGVAKSLLSRKILEIVKDSNNFEYLMNRFSTPDEIFGPISIKKLEDDVYERKTKGYLPTAEIAFLDEIWKASPSIQNTLLTIINEKIYMNGNSIQKVPLLLLIAASNEIPAEGEGLEALYDRFIIRLYVNNIMNKDNFRYVIDTSTHNEKKISEEEKITKDDIQNIQNKAKSIHVDDETFNFICDLKDKLNSTLGKNAPYISDRRWKKIINLLKISAISSDRDQIKPADWLIVKNMIWESEDQLEKILPLFHQIWINNVIKTTSSISISEAEIMIDNLNEEFEKSFVETSKIIKYNYNGLKFYGFISDEDQEMLLLNDDDIKKIKNKYNGYFTYHSTNKKNKKKKKLETINNFSSYYQNFTFNDINDGVIEYKNIRFIRATEKIKNVDLKKMNYVKEKNVEFLKLLNELNSNKSKLIKKLNEEKNLLSSTYDSQLKKLEMEIDNSFKILYEKSSELAGKISLLTNNKNNNSLEENSLEENELKSPLEWIEVG